MKRINLLDGGSISDDAVVKSINTIASTVNSLSNNIGDMSNHDNSTTQSFSSSVVSSIGDISKVFIDAPIGETITNFSESLSPNPIGDFYLTLQPISDISIADGTNTYVMTDITSMSDNTHYAISGRKLIFYKSPSVPFTVTYKGKFPTVPGFDKYAPNTIPNLDAIKTGHQDKSTVTKVDNTTYEVEIKKVFRVGTTLIPNGLNASLPDRLRNFVSPSGSIKAPVEDVSVWVYSDNRFQKISDASVYLMSDSLFRFKTNISLEGDPFIVLSVNSWSLSDSISFLTKLALTHSHDGSDLSSAILHKNLSGLRSKRYVADGQEYGVSLYDGDDHPQYFNRDGYIDGNPGNFNNAIIGDVLIGSSNPYNLYNNVLGNSRKLFFGSVSDGSSMMYDTSFKGLKLFGTNSGLKISTHSDQNDTTNAYATAIELDGNKIYSTGDKGGEDNILNIESKTGVAKFVSSLGGLSTIIAKGLNVRDITATGTISAGKDSSIKIGDIEFKPQETGSVSVESENDAADITFDVPVLIKDLSVDAISPKNLSISGDSSISFGNNSLKSDNGTITLTGKDPLTISDSGKNTGIRYKKQDSIPFGNIYTSAESGGAATETDHDMYFESGNGKTIFLKDTTKVQTAHGQDYGFGTIGAGAGGSVKRVDNLKDMPRSDIDAGNADFYSVSILPSSLKDRRGINIGDTSAIYATGNDTECPPGWLVIESKNGAVFVDSRAGAIDCQTIVYSEVSTGDIKAFGTVSVDKELGVSTNINAGGMISGQDLSIRGKASVGEIAVEGESRFTGHVSFTEDVAINSSLDVGGSITSKNKIHSNELQVDSSAIFDGPVTVTKSMYMRGNIIGEGSINTAGDATVGGKLSVTEGRFDNITSSKAKVNGLLEASGGIETIGNISATGNIETDSDIVADGGKFSTQVKTNNLVVDMDQTVGNELYVAGKFQAASDITLGTNHNDKVNINGNAIFNNVKTAFIGMVDVSDSASFKADLDVTGQASFMSVISSRAGINLEGPITSTSSAEFNTLNVSGPAFVKEDLLASGSVKIIEALNVAKGAVIEGDISLGTKGATLIVPSDAHFTNSKSTFSGEVLMTEKLTVSGDAVINSTMNVKGNLQSDGNLSVEGLSKFKSVKVDLNSEFLGGMSVKRQAQFESVAVTGKSVFDGDISTSGEIYIGGNITSSNNSISTLGTLNLLGAINQSDNKVHNQLAGDTTFNNKVSVSGSLSVKGAIMSGSNTNGMLIEGNSISLIGDTSVVRSKTAYVDNMIGTANKVIPSIGGKSSGAAATAAALSAKRYVTMNNVFVEDAQVNQGDIFCHGTLYVGDMQIIEVPGAERRFEESTTIMNIRARRAKYAP